MALKGALVKGVLEYDMLEAIKTNEAVLKK